MTGVSLHPETPGRGLAADLLISLRPGQWAKNLLVFASYYWGTAPRAWPRTMILRIHNYLLVSADQLIRRGFLQPLERLLLHSPLVVWASLASNVYHDRLWYPTMGQSRTREFSLTEWERPWTTHREATDGTAYEGARRARARLAGAEGVGLWGFPRSARVGFGAKPRLSNNG